MSLPAGFPSSLDSLSNPTATTNRDDAGFELDAIISRIQDILEALEAKVGIGASLPTAAGVLRRTAPGASGWGQVASGDYGALSIGNADVSNTAGIGLGKLSAPTAGVLRSDGAAITSGLVQTGDVTAPSGVGAAGATGQFFVVCRAALDAYSNSAAGADLPGLAFSLTTTATDFLLLGLTGTFENSFATAAICSFTFFQAAVNKAGVSLWSQPSSQRSAVSLWEGFNPGAGTFTYKASYNINAGAIGAYLRFFGILFRR